MFDGITSNLHSVWDFVIITKYRNQEHDDDERRIARDWAQELWHKVVRDSEMECVDTRNPGRCALSWAAETNAWNCGVVFREGMNRAPDYDLGGIYYEEVVPVIEHQILIAGMRLAAWLDELSVAYALFALDYGEVGQQSLVTGRI